MSTHEPPRSLFFSLPPVGVRTTSVESLDGYVCRLAARHRVSPKALRRRLGQEEAGASGRVAVEAWPDSLEKTGPMASIYGYKLAKWTLQPEIEMLGLAPLARHVSPIALLATKNSWCPTCLHEMLVNNQFYVPQCWRLQCYTHCTKHASPLQSACAHCNRTTSSLDVWFEAMGTCPLCHKSLLTERADGAGSTWTEEVVSAQLEAVCASLGGKFGDPFQPLLEPTVSWVIREAIRQGEVWSGKAIAKQAGIGAIVVGKLEHGDEPAPSLQTLVRICAAAALSVEGALRRDFARFRVPRLHEPLQRSSVTHRPHRAIDAEQVRREVIVMLRNGEVPSMVQLQLRFGADFARMSDLLSPKLRARLSKRWERRRAEKKTARFRALVDKIIAARVTLAAMDRDPELHQVTALLGARCSETSHFRKAFAQACKLSDQP